MKIIVCDNYKSMSRQAFAVFKENFTDSSVLGFATGGTPKGLYGLMSRECGSGRMSFRDKVSFNLDEYYPIKSSDPDSYRHYMDENLFKRVDIKEGNINFPNSELDEEDAVKSYAAAYRRMGPVNMQVLGIGANGHIGFNEPGSSKESRIRIVELSKGTIRRNRAKAKRAITMGVKEILESGLILLLASGKDKRDAVRLAVGGRVTPEVPASFLQLHKNTVFILDRDAAGGL